MNTPITYVEAKEKKKGLIKGKDRFPLQEQGQTCLSYPQEVTKEVMKPKKKRQKTA